MATKLDKIVPIGRSYDEYVKMFNLTNSDLNGNILGVGDGPASFNSESTIKGYNVISIDPLYELSPEEISKRFWEVIDGIIHQVKNSIKDWNWSYHKSPENLRNNRIDAFNKFINDFEDGRKNLRYITGELPRLPFTDDRFSLSLCSHLLFLYSDHLDFQFHLNSIKEMMRVSREARIFPLLTLQDKTSQYLNDIIEELNRMNYHVEIEKVRYEFQPGAYEMLTIKE